MTGAQTVREIWSTCPTLSQHARSVIGDVMGHGPDEAALGVLLSGEQAQGWPENRLPVPSGTSLLLYTDGLLDAYAADSSESLGITELVSAAAMRTHAAGAPPGWIARLVHDAPHEPLDDIAAVLLTVEPH